MQNPTNPRWLFLVHTLPLVLLITLCYAEFVVINTLLSPASLLLWQQLSGIVAGLLLVTAGYAAVQLRRDQQLGVGYAVLALAAHVGLLAFCLNSGSELVPWEIPRWMLGMDVLLLVFTFLMPVLAHALFVLVACFTPADRPHRAWLSFLLAFAVPAGWYLLVFVLQGLWMWIGSVPRFVENTMLVLYILSTLSFLFFLVRGVYILGLRRSAESTELHIAWKVLVALVFPLLGLGVNNGLFGLFGGGSSLSGSGAGIFGNFNSYWFYGLAVLNGVLLCLPGGSQPKWRLLLLVGRSVTLAYTGYFFLVFLPFLPISVLAVIAVGVGFLMLTPLVLLVVHVQEISADYAFLRHFFGRWPLRAAIVAGALVLPLGVTASYWHQRQVLHEALAYLYSPNYADTQRLDEQALAGTLAVVRQHKERNQDFMFSRKLPYLSMYFNWLVLDNLTLSDDKLSMMERVFLGPSEYEWQNPDGPPPPPAGQAATRRAVLRNLTTRSTFDKQQQAWESWVNLEVGNPAGTESRTNEYATELELPTGCWINGYYLDIGQRREAGILAEKKAAHWVFSQIVNVNQDPGILHYLSGNRVALRVFPVAGPEVRTTGIRFLHKEPVVVTLDGRAIQLGDTTAAPITAPVTTPDRAVTYLSAAAKSRLPLVRRQPYYHFLLDISKNQGPRKAAFIRQVQHLLAAQPLPGQPRFSFVNTYQTPVPAAEWPTRFRETPNAGGLYLDGAIRRVLAEAWQHPTATYPVIVVVTDKLERAILPPDFTDLSAAYPEAPWFYHQAPDGTLRAHDLRRSSERQLPETPAPGTPVTVRAWPGAQAAQAYLPDNQQADIVLNSSNIRVAETAQPATSWQTGLQLHGYSQWQTRHPETTDAERVPAIKASFRAGIMTPFTSYLALENDAQKAALRRKQNQTLAGNAALDAGEEAPPTSVPIDGGASLLLAAGAALGLKHLRRHKHRSAGPTA